MRQLLPLNALVIALVGALTLAVMIYWHVSTKGTWKKWPAGQSLMLLLGIITVITFNAAANILLPSYWGKIELYFGLYGLLLFAIAFIGWTIRREMRRGKARLREKHPKSGPVTVIVATTNEENPHGIEPTTPGAGGDWTGAPGSAGPHPYPSLLADGGPGGASVSTGAAGLSAASDSDSA
ncbi:hypothetical protein FDH86_gp039 [Arthrobacter phage Tank]|uniref:Holin n=2 Tax=Tankvirus tank TaxID=1982567 RepID=A0A0U4B767_9CAUD|nr:hypothetical protein FDH86_gp039 [Arthrobacter phage Tank]ALY10574.1 hypothetical protein TANK_39 [Arthrobacter phage Tank]ALY10823.1 hypothetical protein WILDE_39 [Arthrobacter phage Wilde]